MNEPEDPCQNTDEEPEHASGICISVSGVNDVIEGDLARAASHALTSHGKTTGQVDIAVVDEAEMCAQHARWMGDDSPTDALTFDLCDEQVSGVVDAQIVVCETVARDRAGQAGHDWTDELTLYVVHGCLHLCDYDDRDPEESARMHAEEDRILVELGRPAVFARGESRFVRDGEEQP